MPKPMSKAEAQRVVQEAKKKLDQWEQPIVLEMDINLTIGIIGMLQLALRNQGAAATHTGQEVRRFLDHLIDSIAPNHESSVNKFLRMGYYPHHDDIDLSNNL